LQTFPCCIYDSIALPNLYICVSSFYQLENPLKVDAKAVLDGVGLGDSIAVNGMCQTLTTEFTVDWRLTACYTWASVNNMVHHSSETYYNKFAKAFHCSKENLVAQFLIVGKRLQYFLNFNKIKKWAWKSRICMLKPGSWCIREDIPRNI